MIITTVCYMDIYYMEKGLKEPHVYYLPPDVASSAYNVQDRGKNNHDVHIRL